MLLIHVTRAFTYIVDEIIRIAKERQVDIIHPGRQ